MRRLVFLPTALPAVCACRQATAQNSPQSVSPADISGHFATEFGDPLSAELFNRLFGPLFPTGSGGGAATAFSTLVGYVNLAVLSVGGLLLAYNIAAGLLQSAHEGEVLGRRWSSLWAPLRVLFAVALLMPMPNLGGYNGVQAGVAWIVKGSTMLASNLWSLGSGVILSGDIPLTGTAARLDGGVFASVYRNQLCLWLANYQFQAAGSPLRVSFETIASASRPIIMSSVEGERENICGSYLLPETPAYIARFGSASPALAGEFSAMHADMLRLLIASADAIIARQWPVLISEQGTLPPVSTSVAMAVSAANQRLSTGAGSILNSAAAAVGRQGDARRLIEEHISGGGCADSRGCFGAGWIGAGNWHMMIARLNSELMGLLNAEVTVRESRHVSGDTGGLNRQVVLAVDSPGWLRRTFSSADANKYLHVEEATRIWNRATGQLDRESVRLAALGVSLSGDILRDAAPSGRSGLFARIWQIGFADAVGGMIDMFSPSKWADDPIVGIVRMGNWYLDAAGALIFGGGAVSLLSGGFGTAVVFLIAAPLAAIGVTQSFIIPMLPFFYWILAVAGYFLLVIEAVAAGSLWALAHLRLDGEGISGDAGRSGWLLLLGLTLTPALMILGYFAAMTLFRVVAGLFDTGMYYAMAALATASPIVAVFGLIAAGLLIVLGYIVMLERSFSLVSAFPGRVLRWVGSEAGLSDGSGEQRFKTATEALASSIGSGASRGGQLAVQRLRSIGA
ncbi:MAG: DotA/TraY family protein [Rhodobacteraceae bacterium]|nr:DotA/TraY family protein [Paracoccaceae bacterium]